MEIAHGFKFIKICVIGGSGGIGKNLFEIFITKPDIGGYRVSNSLFTTSRVLDVTNFRACQNFFIDNQYDVVVNLAGLNYNSFAHKIDESNYFEIKKMIDVNILGSVNVASTCLPGMRERKFGRLIYASSVLAKKNVLGTSVYSASKSFVDRFVKTLALENAIKNVTVNSLRLGYFEGGMTDKLPNKEEVIDGIPASRLGTANELLSTIEYIIQNEYVNGANIDINGGLC